MMSNKNIMYVYWLLALGMAISLDAVSDRWHTRWDWSAVDAAESFDPHTILGRTVDVLRKKDGFKIGAASAEYHILGAENLPHSSMAYGESEMGLEPSGPACGSWHQHFTDISLLKDCGFNTYRFSVDWSAIEPKCGQFDELVLAHYEEFCAELIRQGITPMVTLHHFVHPQWFEELGAFEQSQNIFYFKRFCEMVYRRLGKHVTLWCTINEPGIYMLQTHMRGVFPPFRSISLPYIPAAGLKDSWSPSDRSGYNNLAVAGNVLGNLLRAHVEVYDLLKNIWKNEGAAAGWPNPQVGFAHQYLSFVPFHGDGVFGLLERQIAGILSTWINHSVLRFFKTGTFIFPGAASVNMNIPQAIRSLDFVGLNYYSRVFMDTKNGFKPSYYDEDIETDMPYSIYAEGFYEAIKDVARLGAPIYITENGAPDRADTIRNIWIKRHLFVLAEVMREGYDIRGYYYWTLIDNWEWDMGYRQKFGLYHVDFVTLKRTLRPGSYILRDIARAVTAGR